MKVIAGYVGGALCILAGIYLMTKGAADSGDISFGLGIYAIGKGVYIIGDLTPK